MFHTVTTGQSLKPKSTETNGGCGLDSVCFMVGQLSKFVSYHSTETGHFVAAFSDYCFSSKFTSQGSEPEITASHFLK